MKTFHFTIVDNPMKPMPKKELTAVRKHVMYDYIESSGCDPRPKRRRVDHSPNNGADGQDRSCASSAGRSATPSPRPSKASTNGADRDADKAESALTTPDRTYLPDGSSRAAVENANHISQASNFNTRSLTPYLATNTTQILFRKDGLGSKINPFDSWPAIKKGVYEVERLKWLCKEQGIATKWIPALLPSAIAFYSTICISSAHDDVMYRELNPTGLRRTKESYQRLAVRDGVIKMINEKLDRNDCGDGTIIAVLHILYGEIITGNQYTIYVHRGGVHKLVNGRGSLEALGVNGLLARIIVISMCLVAVMFEQAPDPLYMDFAKKIATEPPPMDESFSRSPMYTATAWLRIKSGDWKFDATTHLLELARQAGDYFAILHPTTRDTSSFSWATKHQAKAGLGSIYDGVFRLKSVSPHEDRASARLETIRLVTCVYVHALNSCIPFSEAMHDLSAATSPRRSLQRCDSVVGAPEPEQASMLLQIKEAMKHTNLDELWDSQSGVLLWAGLVALAASPRSAAEDFSDRVEDRTDEQAARQFIAAAVVRCAIRRMFEHTTGMLGMLKRFVAVQEALADKPKDMVLGTSVPAGVQDVWLAEAAYGDEFSWAAQLS